MSENTRHSYAIGNPWIFGYLRSGMTGATVVDGELVPEEDDIAVFGWDDEGKWVYKGEATVVNVDENLTAGQGTLCAAFLDPERGQYHPFPGCGTTELTIPDAPS